MIGSMRHYYVFGGFDQFNEKYTFHHWWLELCLSLGVVPTTNLSVASSQCWDVIIQLKVG